MTTKPLLLTLAISFFSIFFTLQGVAEENISSNYAKHALSIYSELLDVRQDLFDHPEESGHEIYTSGVVADYLKSLDLEVKTNIGGYGVIGILRGDKPGKNIMWRADMDAARDTLDSSGQSNSEFAHICGHDVHTTIGLGIANTLASDKANLSGTITFAFQPAEESQKGARAMIDDGLFDMVQVDEVYSVHVGPGPSGVISTKAGNVFSHSRNIQIEFSSDVNTEALAKFLDNQMQVLTRIRSPQEFFDLHSTLLDSKLGIASEKSIYQDYALFGGRPRMRTEKDRTSVILELYAAEYEEIAEVVFALKEQINESEFNNHFVSLKVRHDREGVDNDRSLVSQTNQLLEEKFGVAALEKYVGQIPFFSEDFGHFQKHTPGVYFFIGASNAEKGIVAFPHTPDFVVDERVIQYGVTRFSTLVASRAASN